MNSLENALGAPLLVQLDDPATEEPADKPQPAKTEQDEPEEVEAEPLVLRPDDPASHDPQSVVNLGDRVALMALMESVRSGPMLVGRLDKTIEAGELLALTIDSESRPVIRTLEDREIGVLAWHGSE